ncbi:MAG: diacylglycerol kinase [Candidatus Taylorbacteria bacterium]|nr:diacylglycerol kinase [Candidatus Taylorbacteria bacterium]
MHKINEFFFSVKCASKGIKTVLKEEQNFQIEIIIAIFTILLGIFLDINNIEMIMIIISIIIVLTGEMVNTAVEDLCNKIEPHHDSTIGKIKDIMAGFVLITSIGTVVVGLIIFLPKILTF